MESWKRCAILCICWLGLLSLSGCASFNPRIFRYLGATAQESESPAHVFTADRTLGSRPAIATLGFTTNPSRHEPPRLPSPSSDQRSELNAISEIENDLLPPVAKSRVSPTPKRVHQTPKAVLIDFPSALSLAGAKNLDIAAARERIREAQAGELAAKAKWLPSLQLGLNYNKHEGTLQASDGTVLDVSRSSFQTGAGLFAIGAGTPMVPGLALQLRLSDGLFNPKIARATTSAQSSASQAVTKKTYLLVALRYLQLLEAVQEKSIAVDVVQKAQTLAQLTKSFAESGEGAQADADRAKTELVVRENGVIRADEHAETAMARLAELLRFPPSVPILPKEQFVAPLRFVDDSSDTRNLVAVALTNRPEVANSKQLVHVAVLKLKKEKTAMCCRAWCWE